LKVSRTLTLQNVDSLVIAMPFGNVYLWYALPAALIYARFRFFVVALVAVMSVGLQNYLFSSVAASLTSKLRSLTFKAILRQDGGSTAHPYAALL
jgi:hypothetical protein